MPLHSTHFCVREQDKHSICSQNQDYGEDAEAQGHASKLSLPAAAVIPTWVVVKIMVPFRVPIIIRPLIFRVHKKGTIVLTTTHLRHGAPL